MELIKKIRLNDPNSQIVLTTGFPPTSAVIEAMKLGAYDVLRKESLPYDLRPVVEEALAASDAISSTSEQIDPNKRNNSPDETIIGSAPRMQEVFKMVGRASRGDAPVLITGESGAGKEIVADAIHKFSKRSGSEFIAINCAAIPENLLESELFGHEKGSFTGAHSMRKGRFEQCDGGTLFLDEIGDMPIQTQSKILRTLQSGEFSRVGGNETLCTEVRILAATNKDLEVCVRDGLFREDLFYRLNVVRVHIPPLRKRREDIRLLAEFFLKRNADQKKSTLSFDFLQNLLNYSNLITGQEMSENLKIPCTEPVSLPRLMYYCLKTFRLGPVPAQIIQNPKTDQLAISEALETLITASGRRAFHSLVRINSSQIL